MNKIRSVYYLSLSFTALSIKVSDKTVIKMDWENNGEAQVINDNVKTSITSRGFMITLLTPTVCRKK